MRWEWDGDSDRDRDRIWLEIGLRQQCGQGWDLDGDGTEKGTRMRMAEMGPGRRQEVPCCIALTSRKEPLQRRSL